MNEDEGRRTFTVGAAGGLGSDLAARLQFSIFFSYAVISCLHVLSSFKSSSKLEEQRNTKIGNFHWITLMYSQCEDNTDQQLLQAILNILDRFTFLFALSREYGCLS